MLELQRARPITLSPRKFAQILGKQSLFAPCTQLAGAGRLVFDQFLLLGHFLKSVVKRDKITVPGEDP